MHSSRLMVLLVASGAVLTLGLVALAWTLGLGSSGGGLDEDIASADVTSGCDGNAPGTANPAAVYCQELGYEYEIVDTAEGQYGTCAFPDDSKCDEWRFLEGKCGKSYSYCARQGYDLITKTDGKNPFSTEYSVCVDDGQEIDSATELMGLGEKAIRGSRPVQEAPSPPGEGVAAVGQPASFDWRNYDGQDWMTSVKNQASCGSCWAFSGVGTTEAVHNIAAGNPNLDLNLSEEYLVSDCYDWQAASCCGGFQSEALKFIRDNGIPDEACLAYVSGTCSCYPATCNTLLCTYTAGDSCGNAQCSDRCGDWAGRLETITSMGKVSPSQIKQHVVDRGPLAVAMGINLPDSYFDGSNIYRCTDDSTLNHAVIIAGYDDAGGYWIVKNSWGASWGPDGNGYFKVGYGECGIESEVFYASLVDQSCSSYTSTDVPKSIPNPGTVTSDLNVGDSFPLVDVNVGPLNITYPWDEDLDAFLISPLGTRVELFTDVGGDGANFINTVLDDESVYPIEVNDAPFSYTFRPEGVLADLNGEDSSGQWQLEVTDDYPVDVGTLDSWDLELCVGCDPGVDTDGDDFDNDVECYVGTDPLDDCPDVIGIHDAWPFDNNIDTNSNVLDILQYKGNIQFCLPDPGYVQRFDLNTDGCVDVLDILLYKGHLQVQCTNP